MASGAINEKRKVMLASEIDQLKISVPAGSSYMDQHATLLHGLQELYRNQELTDVTLVVEDVRIPCHRLILSASSRYFKAMFMSDLIENMKEEIELYDVDADAVKAIVNYIYTAYIDININNVQSIFSAASLFEMLQLCELCASYMKSELHVTNCVGVFQFGAFHNCKTLKKAGQDYVVDHFCDVMNSEDFMNLRFEEFKDVIEDDLLNVKTEELVYETIVRWIEFDLEERGKYLPKLFGSVRLPLLSEEYTADVIMSNAMIMKDLYCKHLLSMAKIYRATLEIGTSEEILTDMAFNGKKRLGMYNRKMMVFVGGAQERDNRALTSFDPRTKKNYYAIPLHVSFDFKYRIDLHRAVSTHRNEIFLIGGIFYEDHHFEDTGAALAEVKLYDHQKIKWINRAPLSTPRCAHVALHHKGKLYVFGGKSFYPRGAPLDSVECYDTEKDEWIEMCAMPESRSHHAGVVYEDMIYILGGTDRNDQATSSVFQYDILQNMWSILETPMQRARAEFGAAVVNDKLYVIGGCNGNVKLSSVEYLNFTTRRWINGPDFPEDRKSMVTVVFDDCIYVCGGVRTLISRQNRAPRVVETKDLWKYDPETGFWTREAKLVQFANVHACTVMELNTKRIHESEFVSSG